MLSILIKDYSLFGCVQLIKKIKDDEDIKHVNDYFDSLIYTGFFYTYIVYKVF